MEKQKNRIRATSKNPIVEVDLIHRIKFQAANMALVWGELCRQEPKLVKKIKLIEPFVLGLYGNPKLRPPTARKGLTATAPSDLLKCWSKLDELEYRPDEQHQAVSAKASAVVIIMMILRDEELGNMKILPDLKRDDALYIERTFFRPEAWNAPCFSAARLFLWAIHQIIIVDEAEFVYP